jgi:hypothetical protein
MHRPLVNIARAGFAAALLPLVAARVHGQVATQAGASVVTSAGNPVLTPSASIGGRATATSAMAARITTPPVLDGRTDDPAWTTAQVIDQFLEYDPNEGKETRFKTEVRITYDDRNLYVLARMYDPAPDSIISLLSRRDVRTTSEQLKIKIHT